jgi:hypothetical protein
VDTQAALKNKHEILNKIKEMQNDESKQPNRKTMLKVTNLMKSISEVAVRKLNNSLAPFYLWVCVMYSNIDNDTSILLIFKCLMLDYLFSTLAGTENLFSKSCLSPPPATSSELNGNPPPDCVPIAASCVCYHL